MPTSRGVHAHLIDLSDAALARSVQTLATIDALDIRVTTQQATYEDGLLALPTEAALPTLVAFLGSNIGNFDPPGAAAFLGLLRAALHPRDYLLLGADLVKPERELLLAYDDPLGLTAAFNKNLLLRMNTELGADFELGRFAHRAVWNRTRHASKCTWSAWRPRRSTWRRPSSASDCKKARQSGPRVVQVPNRLAFVSSSSPQDSSSGISGSTSAHALR